MSSSLIILVGPSGSGKTSVQEALIRDRSLHVRRFITSTTRKPRSGEKNGRDYWFLSRENFKCGIKKGRFYEWALVYGEYYGSDKERMQRARQGPGSIILTLDTHGAETLKRAHADALVIFIDAPIAKLRERLLRRNTARIELEARLRRIAYERRWKRHADIAVMNRDGVFDQTMETVISFVKNKQHVSG